MRAALNEREDYWTQFYSEKARSDSLQPPSQFAAFVAQEIEPEVRFLTLDAEMGAIAYSLQLWVSKLWR